MCKTYPQNYSATNKIDNEIMFNNISQSTVAVKFMGGAIKQNMQRCQTRSVVRSVVVLCCKLKNERISVLLQYNFKARFF